MSALDRYLKHLQEEADRARPSEEAAEELQAWLSALEALFAQIEAWLKPVVDAGHITIEKGEAELVEQEFGVYRAPTRILHVIPERRVVNILPRGARIVGVMRPGGGAFMTGARGRVDLVCGPNRAVILRDSGGAWTLAYVDGGDPGTGMSPLDADSLVEAIRAITE
jgi:hypothetical protein